MHNHGGHLQFRCIFSSCDRRRQSDEVTGRFRISEECNRYLLYLQPLVRNLPKVPETRLVLGADPTGNNHPTVWDQAQLAHPSLPHCPSHPALPSLVSHRFSPCDVPCSHMLRPVGRCDWCDIGIYHAVGCACMLDTNSGGRRGCAGAPEMNISVALVRSRSD